MTKYKFLSFFILISTGFVLAYNACSAAGSGISSTASCSSCVNSATSTVASISISPLSNIGFTMVNGYSLYANCNGANTGGGIFCYTGKSVTSAGIYPQQYQLSGFCSTGGANSNKIYLTVENSSGTMMTTDVYGNAYSTTSGLSTTCDNGRFSILLTQPGYDPSIYPLCTGCSNTTLLNGGTYIATSPALKLLVNLMTGPSNSSLSLASQAATTFQVSYYY